MEIDWAALRGAATEVMGRAYAPYSGFAVGAAGLAADGRVLTGCNVENAGYGVTLCAECGVVSALHASGGGPLVALSCVDAAGEPLMPCGRCRQLLWEHGGPDCLVDAAPRPLRLVELLPYAFDVTDLDRAPAPRPLARPADRRPGGRPALALAPALVRWRGRGTVFVHPDVAGGQRVWTAYWERSAGWGQPAGESAGPPGPAAGTGGPAPAAGPAGEPVGILEEGPHWTTAADAVAWGRARTTRVVVVRPDGTTAWAGEGEPPPEVDGVWRA